MAEDDDWEHFLERNLYELSQRIIPGRFYGWLRSQGVFSRDDQEEVENSGKTSAQKSEHLIDTVRRKGRAGYDAFMSVVQFEYPHIYRSLTGNEPKKPTREFMTQSNCSLDLMPQLMEVLTGISSSITTEGRRVKRLMKELELENECMKKKLEGYEDLEKKNSNLNDRLLRNQEQSIHYVEERDAALGQCSEYLKERDEALQENNELMVKLGELSLDLEETKGRGNLERQKTLRLRSDIERRPTAEQVEQLTLEKEELRTRIHSMDLDYAKYSSSAKRREDRETALGVKVQEMVISNEDLLQKLKNNKDKLQSLEKFKGEVEIEKEELSNTINTLQLKVNNVSKQNDVHKLQAAQFVKERDQYLDRCVKLEKQNQELTNKVDMLLSSRQSLWASQDQQQDRMREYQNELRLLRGPLRNLHAADSTLDSPPATDPDMNHNPFRERTAPIDKSVVRPKPKAPSGPK